MEIINRIENSEPSDGEYISYEDFEGLEDIELIPYTVEEEIPFAEIYDKGKIEHLNELNVDIPEEWLGEEGKIKEKKRNSFLTMHIVVCKILTAEETRGILDENEEEGFDEIIEDMNKQLEEEKRVSRDELHAIVRYALSELKKEDW